MKEENVALDVKGMSCTNCALTITKYLEKQGMQNVYVDFIQGKVNFSLANNASTKDLIKGINSLGYQVMTPTNVGDKSATKFFESIDNRFYFCLIFTLPLLLHMVLPIGLLHHPIVQLLLCIPVIIVGMMQFGKSAWNSVKSGIPNMDVLITIGSAFLQVTKSPNH